MQTTEPTSSTSLRCSAWARAAGLDPVGSAGCYRGFLVVEIPNPWPRDVGETEQVASLRDLVAGAGVRVQALLGPGGRVACYLNRLDGAFAGFERWEADGVGDLRTFVESVLADGGPPQDGGRDLLVCTHGRRDVCCGSLGTHLASELEQMELPAGVRLWRTSHTGGHRFAPTFVVLPEGTLWAYADTELVGRVLDRSGDFSEVAGHYRGCAGLPSAAAQALEREVMRRVGWGLLDRTRRAFDGPGATVRLAVEGSGLTTKVWEAEVVPGRRLPVPDCGRPIEEAKKSETEWVVAGLRLTD